MLQLDIIEKSRKLYKFIDFVHYEKKQVPLRYPDTEPPIKIRNALMFKMKADILKYIYECISGDNGLLYEIKGKKEE